MKFCGIAVALLLVSSCGGSSDSTEISLDLRSGVSQVFELPKENYAGAVVGSFSPSSLSLRDVSRDGDTLFVTLQSGHGALTVWHNGANEGDPSTVGSSGTSADYPLLLSENGGKSFTSVSLPSPPYSVGYLQGVHIWQGHAMAVGFVKDVHPMGSQDQYPAVEFDLKTHEWFTSATMKATPFLAMPRGAGDGVRSFAVLGDSTGTHTAVTEKYTLGSHVVSRPYIEQNAPCWNYLWNPEGTLAVAACETATGSHCQSIVDATMTDWSMTSTCISATEIGGTSYGAVLTKAGVMSLLKSDAGFTGLVVKGSERTRVALGPGESFDDGAMVHHRWSGLVHLQGGGINRLVDVSTAENPVEVKLPRTPCKNDENCGERVWSLALGGDDYLNFYVVNTFIDHVFGSHMRLFVSRDHATRVPINATAAQTTPIVLPNHPSATPAGPINAQCLAAQHCMPTFLWQDCSNQWAHTPFGNPALARFLAASPTDCAALKAANPTQSLLHTMPCQVGCRGDIFISSCERTTQGVFDPTTSKVELFTDCTLYGSHCLDPGDGHGARCSDGSVGQDAQGCTPNGSAVMTSQGGRIDVNCPGLGGQTCTRETWNTEATCSVPCSGPSCQGNVAVLCTPPEPGSKTDCSVLGQTCSPTAPSGCVSPASTEIGVATHCEGNLLLFGFGNPRYFDCASIGTTCTDIGQPSHCL